MIDQGAHHFDPLFAALNFTLGMMRRALVLNNASVSRTTLKDPDVFISWTLTLCHHDELSKALRLLVVRLVWL